MARKFVIQKTVVDLRGEPKELPPLDYSHQPLRESQLLFGERIELISEQGDWLYIGALEQSCYNEELGWHPYRGWIHRSEALEVKEFPPLNFVITVPEVTLMPSQLKLTYGTFVSGSADGNLTFPPGFCPPEFLRPLNKNFDPQQLVNDASYFLNAPYLWGGRALYPHSSVDCSGLVQLLYRGQGILLPRNAHDQYLQGTPTSSPRPGDLLFLTRGKRMTHVVMRLNETQFIESPQTGRQIRLLNSGQEIYEKEGVLHISDREHPYQFFFRKMSS